MSADKVMSKQRRAWSMLLIALTSACGHVQAYNTTCILPKAAPGSPIRPQVSNQFSVHVEATFLDKNHTVEVIEYYDYDHNRGRLRQIENGTITDYYYDYSTNELLVVRPDLYRCQVQQLNTSNYVYLLGDSYGHIFSPAAALRFSRQGTGREVYLGEGQVRGINVHQWSSCQDWPQVSTFMHLTWSFMDNMNWVASAAASSVPVECHVTGKVYAKDGSYRSFEHLYEFVHYNDAPFPLETFQIPSGIVCPGRVNTAPLPTLPPSMQFTGQTVDEGLKTFTYTQEKYDTQARLVVFEYLEASPFTARYGTDSLTVVSDFNTGTEYVLDAKRGNCTISPMTSDPDLAGFADPVTLRLKSAEGILDLTGADYIYIGESSVRGVPCQTWIAQKSGTDGQGGTVNTTYQWAFTQPGWRNLNDPSGVSAVPMQLIHTLENHGSRQQTVKNVYDYVGSVPDILDGVSVDSCFIGLPRNLVVFSIANVYSTLLQYFQQEFRHAVHHSVAQVLDISPLRVANIQYRLQQFTVDVWLDLLSVSPVHSAVMTPTTERSLDDATQDLIAAVRGSRLVIELFGYSPRPTYITADPASLRISRFNQVQVITNTHLPVPPSPRASPAAAAGSTTPPGGQGQGLCGQHTSSDDRYSAGVMAGTAVSMGVVGGALGLLTHRLLLRSVG